MTSAGLFWRLLLAIVGLLTITTVIVWGALGLLNWLALAEQLTGLCWMAAATSSLVVVIWGVFQRREDSTSSRGQLVSDEIERFRLIWDFFGWRRGSTPAHPETPLINVELAVGHAIYLFSNRSLCSSRHLAPSFVEHLGSLGFKIVSAGDTPAGQSAEATKANVRGLEVDRDDWKITSQKWETDYVQAQTRVRELEAEVEDVESASVKMNIVLVKQLDTVRAELEKVKGDQATHLCSDGQKRLR